MDKHDGKFEVLRVAASSSANLLAGALAANIQIHGKGELLAIGAGAVNQAVKGIAIARGYLAPAGYNLVCVPAFIDIKTEDELEKTAIKIIVTTVEI